MCDLNKNSNFNQINHKNKSFNIFIIKQSNFSIQGKFNEKARALIENKRSKIFG